MSGGRAQSSNGATLGGLSYPARREPSRSILHEIAETGQRNRGWIPIRITRRSARWLPPDGRRTVSSLQPCSWLPRLRQVDHGVAQGRHHLRRKPAAHATGILAEGDIPDVVQAVFDVPVALDPLGKPGCVRTVAAQGSDVPRNLHLGLSRDGASPLESDDLGQTRPVVRILVRRAGRADRTTLDAAVPLFEGECGPLLLQTACDARRGESAVAENASSVSRSSVGWLSSTARM